MSDTVCIGCGCDDSDWLRIDREEYRGVCSSCPEHVERWDAGDREFDRDVIAAAEEQEDREYRRAFEDDDDSREWLRDG